ncbi:MAG: ankyrin repeat domain-containing protein [Parachlamydia sp.]|nr:ankyrin repeat domain-containing protein [Parachlamydia sp.]
MSSSDRRVLSPREVERYNQISVLMGVLDRQNAFHRTRIAGIDSVMREIVGTIVNIAEEQFALLSAFLQEPPERRSTVILQAMLKHRMETIRDNAIESYDVLIGAKDAVMEQGRMVPLTRDKRTELINLYRQKINTLLQQYQDQNGGLRIDASTDLAALKQKMQSNLNVYERMLDSKVPMTYVVEQIETKMTALRLQRQALLDGDLNLWTACERGDIAYLQAEINKLWDNRLVTNVNNLFSSEKILTREEYVNQRHAGTTPLHIACASRQHAIVQLLLGHGAKWDARDEGSYTPLHRAAQVGDVAIATELIRAGCPVDVLGRFKRTPLHNATYNGRVEMTRFLLEQGANINAQTDAEGTSLTPLHDAVRMNCTEVVALLTRYEALEMLRDKHGQTPLEYALLGGMIINAALIVGHNRWTPGEKATDPDHIPTLLKIKIPENEAEIRELLTSQDPILYSQPTPAAAQPVASKPPIPKTPPTKPAPLFEFVYGGKVYKRCVTKGDGFCAVHALLGTTNQNQIVEWEGSRKNVTDLLRDTWKTKKGEVINYFRAFFEGLSQHVGKRNSEYDPLLTTSEILREPLTELQKNLKAAEGKPTAATDQRDLIDRFIDAHLDTYLGIFEKQDYFLTHTELEMIAHLKNKNILILNTKRVADTKMEQQKVDHDAIIIWHEGLHYERCEVKK